MKRPLVKICGITSVHDAELVADLGADMVGLNFWPRSPRFVEEAAAVEIADAVRGRTRLVGVFVDSAAPRVEELAGRLSLDLLQFHGDETPDYVAAFGARAIKVVKVRGRTGPAPFVEYPRAWGFLFDTWDPDLVGGTGREWSYERLGALDGSRPFLVAGGIRPDNVLRALRSSGAAGVDVCSGVESAPGIKSPELLRRLFDEVRHGER